MLAKWREVGSHQPCHALSRSRPTEQIAASVGEIHSGQVFLFLLLFWHEPPLQRHEQTPWALGNRREICQNCFCQKTRSNMRGYSWTLRGCTDFIHTYIHSPKVGVALRFANPCPSTSAHTAVSCIETGPDSQLGQMEWLLDAPRAASGNSLNKYDRELSHSKFETRILP